MLSLIIFSLITLASVNAQATVSCAYPWPGIQPGDDGTVDSQCYVYASQVPIGSVALTLLYDASWKGATALDQMESVAGQAVLASIAAYEPLQDNIADVVVILTNDGNDYYAGTNRPLDHTGPCSIKLYRDWFNLNVSDSFRMQVIAHEMYHCVQQTLFGNSVKPSPWWIEGSANYFSNVVYPRQNNEWLGEHKYNPELPLYSNNHYSTGIFFQAMEQSKGPTGINNWVRNQIPQLPTDDEEKQRLSSYPDFPDDFHLFAQQFSLGKVRDSDGYENVPIDFPVSPQPVVLTSGVPLAEGTVATATLQNVPFTVQVFAFSLDNSQTVSISYSTKQPNVRISYKQKSDTVWTTMPNSPVSSAEGTLVLECDASNDATTILVLFSSTDNVDSAEAEITIVQVSQDDTCQCKQPSSNKRGLDSCSMPSVSSSASPTSTISSDISSDSSSTTSSSSSSTTSSTSSSTTSSTSSSTTGSSMSSSTSSTASSASASTTSSPSPSPTSSPSSSPSSSGAACTAVASQPTSDPCLTGKTWTLDNAAIEALIRSRLASNPSETINSLSITGTGTLEITGSNATFTYTGYTAEVDVSADGLDVPTKTVINGVFEANLYLQAEAEFCLDVYTGEGSAVETDPITGGFTVDLGPDGEFVEQQYRIGYQCASGTLSMQGTLNGNVAWGPYAFTS